MNFSEKCKKLTKQFLDLDMFDKKKEVNKK